MCYRRHNLWLRLALDLSYLPLIWLARVGLVESTVFGVGSDVGIDNGNNHAVSPNAVQEECFSPLIKCSKVSLSLFLSLSLARTLSLSLSLSASTQRTPPCLLSFVVLVGFNVYSGETKIYSYTQCVKKKVRLCVSAHHRGDTRAICKVKGAMCVLGINGDVGVCKGACPLIMCPPHSLTKTQVQCNS